VLPFLADYFYEGCTMRRLLMLGTALLLAPPTAFAQTMGQDHITFLSLLPLIIIIIGGVLVALMPLFGIVAEIEADNRRREESKGGGFIE
jgi:hypothetical protein